ncbi:MAG: S-methyl-5-thioribose-1-phosphate isomerase [Deltaproteobacteria bacterium]|nr:S-methyl-5-thioribose-1-phosphate isomerase [Deltaproteobacteria bacterium]
MSLTAIRFDSALHLLDQRLLPRESRWVTCRTAAETADAIASMVVRGAPAIAITAAYGMALAQGAGADMALARAALLASRPTAVNLRWALERLDPLLRAGADLLTEARRMHEEDVAINRALGAHGAPLLQEGVLTICNTGTLATGGWGTALGMVRSAREAGRAIHVYALETRPYDQGARLTTYECSHDGIPCTLLADSMAGALMAAGRVRSVVVGCDRVAANGDAANKIGTYNLAVLARHHALPFYVAMPSSTLDAGCPDGASIPIEERPAEELFAGLRGVSVWNPAFDVTPAELITAWVSEHGVSREGPLP